MITELTFLSRSLNHRALVRTYSNLSFSCAFFPTYPIFPHRLLSLYIFRSHLTTQSVHTICFPLVGPSAASSLRPFRTPFPNVPL